jgi:hypothetical protein
MDRTSALHPVSTGAPAEKKKKPRCRIDIAASRCDCRLHLHRMHRFSHAGVPCSTQSEWVTRHLRQGFPFQHVIKGSTGCVNAVALSCDAEARCVTKAFARAIGLSCVVQPCVSHVTGIFDAYACWYERSVHIYACLSHPFSPVSGDARSLPAGTWPLAAMT